MFLLSPISSFLLFIDDYTVSGVFVFPLKEPELKKDKINTQVILYAGILEINVYINLSLKEK
jgi:hypothetical protein